MHAYSYNERERVREPKLNKPKQRTHNFHRILFNAAHTHTHTHTDGKKAQTSKSYKLKNTETKTKNESILSV